MKQNLHIESLSNGLGGQSVRLFLMACRREIPATVSITADTGWEFDRLWSNGRRASSKVYFDEVITPLALQYGFDARFVQAVDENKKPLPALIEHTRWCATSGKFNNLKIPMFGSKGGRLLQSCTQKWKIRAINQELRRMGAKTACTYQGIHSGESSRRVSGWYLHQHKDAPWISVYQDTVKVTKKDAEGNRVKTEKAVKWLTHAYPLVDMNENREICRLHIAGEKIPYLISSECDGCPHKDLPRWERTDPAVLKDLAELEALFNGEFFFTDKRIPLLQAIEAMKKERTDNPKKYDRDADFGCQNAICGV